MFKELSGGGAPGPLDSSPVMAFTPLHVLMPLVK